MFIIDYKSGLPIFEQIYRGVVKLGAAGAFGEGGQLPSVRAVARELGVNPNTIQKACRLLEEEGLIQSRSGAKSYVSAEPELVERVRSQLLAEDARRLVEALRQTGASKEDCMALFQRIWDESERGAENE